MADNENGYTSEQCKYRLFRMLQRNFSLEKERDRYYTRDFFFKLLDGVEVSIDAYKQFVKVMDDDLDYCAKHKIDKVDDVTDTMINERKGALIDAFAAIGIDLVVVKESWSGYLTFTKPDGTVLTYNISDGTNDFYINAACGQEINYAKLASRNFQMTDMEIKNISDDNYQMASKDIYWEYDADTTTMTITGTGVYRGVTKETQLGSGNYTTLILGAEIPELNFAEAYSSSALTTVVLLHPADFPLIITLFDYSSRTTARSWNVYTDNEVFRNHAWNEKLSITWHTLDEWEG